MVNGILFFDLFLLILILFTLQIEFMLQVLQLNDLRDPVEVLIDLQILILIIISFIVIAGLMIVPIKSLVTFHELLTGALIISHLLGFQVIFARFLMVPLLRE